MMSAPSGALVGGIMAPHGPGARLSDQPESVGTVGKWHVPLDRGDLTQGGKHAFIRFRPGRLVGEGIKLYLDLVARLQMKLSASVGSSRRSASLTSAVYCTCAMLVALKTSSPRL